MEPTVPSTPDPTWTALIARFIRLLLQALAGYGLIHGAVSDEVVTGLAGVIVLIATGVWTVVEAKQNSYRTHQAAVLSANIQSPVQLAR
jgi:cell shape-determining protein MreD